MYQEHFGFQNPPFEDRLAQDGEIFIGAKQKATLANLKIALGTRDAVIVLTGPTGVGKTALGAHSLRTTTTRLALAWIDLSPLTGHELLEHLLTEFGFNPYKCSRVERLQMWRQFLNEMSMTETRVGILIEKTENVGSAVLQTLESLTSATPNACPGANVILTGDPALRDLLRAPELESLRQRTRLSQTLEALNPQELSAFLDYKFEAAAGNARALFADGAIAMLHYFSKGRIRVVKNLCETALTIAAVRKERQLTPRLIAQVAVGLFGLEPQSAAAVNAGPQDAPAFNQETEAGSSTGGARNDGADVKPDLEPDVPILTESVEIAADPLLDDVAAGKQVSPEAASPRPAAHGSGADVETGTRSDEDGDLNDDDELLDPQQDALQAFANAQALEDISNSMAETLFGDAELAQLGATLAVTNSGECDAGATEGRQAPPASPHDRDEARAKSAVGTAAPRFA